MKTRVKKIIAILVSLLLLAPQLAVAAAVQPPGQFPETQPLRPLDVNVAPNYSENIQDTDELVPVSEENNAAAAPDEADAETGAENSAGMQAADSGQSTGKWWIVAIVIVAVIVGGVWLWRRKRGASGAAPGTAVIVLALLWSAIVGLSAGIPVSQAQSLPENGQPIQRVIIPEEELTQQATPEAQASNTVIYALSAIGLVLIGFGAAWLFWAKHPPRKP